MFTLNNFNFNFSFANKVWWRNDYFPFEIELYLRNLKKFRKSLECFKNQEENFELLCYYSEYYKREYIVETVIGENNININVQDWRMFVEENILSNLNGKDHLKINNLKTALDKLFPKIFCPNLSQNSFNENLAIELHKTIGQDLFRYPGKYRTKDAKPANEDYFYLKPESIQIEMKKLFDYIRNEFIDLQKKDNIEDLIKLGVLFFINFLTIHPFENGNGRCARLLLSYLLSSVTIVSLSLYTKHNGREVYLTCLRDERNKSPTSSSTLASLILECAYFNIEKVCIFFDIYPDLSKNDEYND